jgi:hypothetical protein
MVLLLDADAVHLFCKGDVEYFGEADSYFKHILFVCCFLWTVIVH